MTLSIESLVRPFQTVDVFAGAPRRGPVDPAPGAVVLEIGKNGSPKSLTGSESFSSSGYMTQKHQEKERKVQPLVVHLFSETGAPLYTEEELQSLPPDAILDEGSATINATVGLTSKSGRGRNFQEWRHFYNKKGETTGTTVSKDGPEIDVKNKD